MRVLHLVESPVPAPGRRAAPDACEAALLACAGVLRAMPADHEVVLVGPSAADRVAAGLGLRITARISTPCGDPRRGMRALRSWLEDRPRHDMACAWSAATAELAALARLRPRAAVLLGPPARREELADVDASFVGSAADRASWGAWGGTRGAPALVRIAPGDVPGDRVELRARLGLAPHEVAVLHLADPFETGDPVRFMFVAGLVDRAGCPLTAVVPRAHRQLTRLRRLHATSSGRLGLIVADRPTLALLPACDLALIEGGASAMDGESTPITGAIRLAIATARRAGVRVIAPSGSEREGVLSARGVAPQELAATILSAIERRTPSPDAPDEPGIDWLHEALTRVGASRINRSANARPR